MNFVAKKVIQEYFLSKNISLINIFCFYQLFSDFLPKVYLVSITIKPNLISKVEISLE